MIFTVNGVDFLPYLQDSGLEYTRNPVDGPNAGRTASGTMIRDYLTDKITWKGKCRPLTTAQLSTVLQAIHPDRFTVVYTDPDTAATTTGYFYSSSVPATLLRTDGTVDVWGGLAFTLVEF